VKSGLSFCPKHINWGCWQQSFQNNIYIKRILEKTTDSNTVIISGSLNYTLQIPHVKSSLYRLTFKSQLISHLFSSHSSSTAVSRDSLNYDSFLGFSLYSLGADSTESTLSIVIAQKYLDFCLLISCRGTLFTESLPSNERLIWLRYSGFQASCHNT
jgi:hypothetical protein